MTMERNPVEAPLPCYGNELDLTETKCQRCPHMRACSRDSGSRRDKVPINEAVFRLIPPSFGHMEVMPGEDPELAHIGAVYSLCHEAVFGKHVRASVRHIAAEVAAAAAAMDCSIRLYILAVMVGFQQDQQFREAESDRTLTHPFSPNMLTGARAARRAENYAHVCRSRFGTFNLQALDMITDGRLADQAVETRMFNSELIAAKFIVGRKATDGGLVEPDFYRLFEYDLDEHWLAIEPSYTKTVLFPKEPVQWAASKAILRKRFDVKQTIARMKRHTSAGFAAHAARNAVMAEVTQRVLQHFRIMDEMLEVPVDPVTNAFEFWKSIGNAIQHIRCLRIYFGSRFEQLWPRPTSASGSVKISSRKS